MAGSPQNVKQRIRRDLNAAPGEFSLIALFGSDHVLCMLCLKISSMLGGRLANAGCQRAQRMFPSHCKLLLALLTLSPCSFKNKRQQTKITGYIAWGKHHQAHLSTEIQSHWSGHRNKNLHLSRTKHSSSKRTSHIQDRASCPWGPEVGSNT